MEPVAPEAGQDQRAGLFDFPMELKIHLVYLHPQAGLGEATKTIIILFDKEAA